MNLKLSARILLVWVACMLSAVAEPVVYKDTTVGAVALTLASQAGIQLDMGNFGDVAIKTYETQADPLHALAALANLNGLELVNVRQHWLLIAQVPRLADGKYVQDPRVEALETKMVKAGTKTETKPVVGYQYD